MNILKRLWQSVRLPSPFAIPSEPAMPASRRRGGRLNAFEQMESRVLLTTMTAGTYNFVDSAGDPYTITLTGNITVEAYASDGASLVDLTDDTAATPLDIYAIYVTQSDLSASLTVTGGGTGTISLNNGAYSSPTGAGTLFIGDRLSGLPANEDWVVLSVGGGGAISPEAQALVDLASPGVYRPGIYVAGDIDEVYVEGTITGEVYVGGTVTYFATDWLLTGGGLGGGNASDEDFYVGGNLVNLVVNTSVGTDQDTIDLTTPTPESGVDIHVVGRIGTVWVRNAFVGSIAADNLFGDDGYFWYEASSWSAPFSTFADPYFLGTNSDQVDGDGIDIVGSIQGFSGTNTVDYYAFGAMAGKTYNILLDVDISAQLVVFDPDGRLIFTGSTNEFTGERTFSFTADRAGAYRVAIANEGDRAASGVGGATDDTGYTLRVAGMTETAIGAIDVGEDMMVVRSGIVAGSGDIGVINVGGAYLGMIDIPLVDFDPDIIINDGNLVAMDASDIGAPTLTNGLIGQADISVVGGGVGLVKSGGFMGALIFAEDDIQILDVAGRMEGWYVTNGAIGVIRAGSIEGNEDFMNFIAADYDRAGHDGFIDLIDVAGTFGTIEYGGPRITTGTGGNLRFLKVGGPLFQDQGFVGGETGNNGGIAWGIGESAVFRDDSGALITIKPEATGSLITYTYGIWGSGGVAIARIEANSSLNIAVSSNNNSALERTEVGEIRMSVIGAPLTTTDILVNGLPVSVPAVDPVIDPLLPPSFLTISGRIPTDIFLISGTGTLNTISNATRGDIVNVNFAGDIGTLSVPGNLGSVPNTTGAEINQRAVIAAGFPFDQQHIGIVANNIAVLSAGKSIANVVAASIGTLTANAGNVNDPHVFEGIAGPIQLSGSIGAVNIGEGLMESGSVAYSADVDYGASMSRGGIYASGTICRVSGVNADIRGDLISTTTIGPISLNNGSIVGSQIAVYMSIAMADYFSATNPILPDGPDLISAPIFEIVSVTLTGNGGILSSLFAAADMGPVSVATTGFGFLASGLFTVADGVVQGVTAGGYGIRYVFTDSARLNVLNATGKGNVAPVSNYSIRVRGSESGSVDPLTGIEWTVENDLAMWMANYSEGDYRTGIIAESAFTGSLALGNVTAFTLTDVELRFANTMGNFKIGSDVGPLQIITGSVASFVVNGDVGGLDFQVAGKVGLFQINGDFVDGLLYAKGPSSNIEKLVVTGEFLGDFTSEGLLGSMTVGKAGTKGAAGTGSFTGNVELFGGVSANAITFNAGFAGTFLSHGNIGAITFKEGLEAGNVVTVNGNLGTLTVGGTGAVNHGFAGTVDIVGNLTKLVVTGGFTGTANVAGNLGSATVSGATTGALNVIGNVGNFTQKTAAFDGVLNAGGSITTFAANVVNAAASIAAASIATFTLKGSATGGQVNVTGNLTNMNVTGSLTGTQILVGGLGTLTLKGNFAAGTMLHVGATGPASTINITGALAGVLTSDGAIKTLSAANITSAVVVTGLGIETLTVKNALLNSLVQTGLTAGDDGVFGTVDANETVAAAAIGRITAGTMTNTTIFSGGAITSLTVTRNLVNSAVSTALVLDGAAVQTVIAGGNALSSVVEVTTLRMNPTLQTGNFGLASVARGQPGGLDADSYLSAGVSPGADGAFGTADDVYDGVSVLVKVTVSAAPGHLLDN